LGGIEATFDDELRGVSGQTDFGVFANRWLHRVPRGHSVRLTLDTQVQRAADTALGDRAGAVVVLSVPDGEVIALVSHPTFDPATLDQDWEQLRVSPSSPLLNRATQGLYQPGAAFQTVVLAEALSRGLVSLTSTVPISAPVALGNTVLTCATTPLTSTLASAFAAGCPAPFDALHDDLDAKTLTDMLHRWQFDLAPKSFELPVNSSSLTSAALTTTQAMRELILGQGALTVSPLQMATVMGTIANGGVQIGAPHLTFISASASPTLLLSPEIANAIQSSLVQDDAAGQVALAVSGDHRLAWYLGFSPALSPRWAIVVLLEQGDATACRQVAASVKAKLSP
jgi:peptidoglycan glycosyltransferase